MRREDGFPGKENSTASWGSPKAKRTSGGKPLKDRDNGSRKVIIAPPTKLKRAAEDIISVADTAAAKQDTPPAQVSTSPEILRKSPRSTAEGCCFGTPVLGLAVGRVRDRRKTKPRGILTVISSAVDHSPSSLMPMPAMASVKWLSHDATNSSFEFDSAPNRLDESSSTSFFAGFGQIQTANDAWPGL